MLTLNTGPSSTDCRSFMVYTKTPSDFRNKYFDITNGLMVKIANSE